MNQHNNGGPAFPVIDHLTRERVVSAHPGMTLRDYFAAKAMQGELSAQCEESGHYAPDGKALADRCYAFADAMLKAREAK